MAPTSRSVATTTQKIVISQDNVVELVTERREAVSTIPEVMRAIQGSGMTTPILPFGTIQAIFKDECTRYFVMTPPKIVDITYVKGTEESPIDAPLVSIFTIAMPWTLFVFAFAGRNLMDVWSAVAKPPILDSSSPLFALPLPNCDRQGKRCMGSDFGLMVNGPNKQSPIDRVNKAIAYFDSSRYNQDLRQQCECLPDQISMMCSAPGVWGKLKAWADWTAKTPKPLSSITTLEWHQTMYYGDLIERSVL